MSKWLKRARAHFAEREAEQAFDGRLDRRATLHCSPFWAHRLGGVYSVSFGDAHHYLVLPDGNVMAWPVVPKHGRAAP